MARRFSAVLVTALIAAMLVDASISSASEADNLDRIPFVRKRPDFGGEACLASVLRWHGKQVDQDFVFDRCQIDPLLGRGAVTRELVSGMQSMGLKPGPVWFPISSNKSLDQVWAVVQRDLVRQIPHIVVAKDSAGHERFLLITGYDKQADKVRVHDPNRDDGAHAELSRKQLLSSMALRLAKKEDASPQFQAVAIRCAGQPGDLQMPKSRFTDADYAQHIRQLKSRLPSDDFQIVIQKPFVVVGDGGLESVRRTAERTVKWAVDGVKQDYFESNPREIIDVWLFKDAASYKKHNQQLFGKQPTTPYGYYSPSDRALVMDISTGGGTLVHEIVHPFMEANFPRCPSWFNEGLASLYEQSSRRNGHIIGLTNWRLRGLQLAIEDDRLGSFQTLCETSRREFYQGAGTNYAQARYLCYYLQEKGLLVKYYHAFVKNAAKDPSGYLTLQQVLGRTDMKNFQQEWEKYVSGLRFP